MDDLKKTILDYVVHEYLEEDDDEIGTDTELISGGIVDSFSMVSLKRFLEKKYEISIPDADASRRKVRFKTNSGTLLGATDSDKRQLTVDADPSGVARATLTSSQTVGPAR